MQRWGTTAAGAQRWRCKDCAATSTRKRPDRISQINGALFVRWLTGSERLGAIAGRARVTPRTLHKRFSPFWRILPTPILPNANASVLVVDGVGIVKRKLVTLIAHEPERSIPVDWAFVPRESYETWRFLFQRLKRNKVHPLFVVCDGQRGMLKALFEVWPDVTVQRCIIHVIRQANLWLTQHPKTLAGAELRCLVKQLTAIRTRRQKRRWIRSFKHWCRSHNGFLKERAYSPTNPKRWWYTHRKLRAVKSLLRNAQPHLFTYVRHRQVPRTSNHVEGGINSRLKDLLRIHRGLSPRKKQVLTAWYLAVRQGQKPTRNFY